MCYADQIKPVNPKGNQPWIVIGAKAETPILFPPDAKSQVTGKDPDSGKDRSQEEKGWQDETDGWMASPTQWTWVWASYGRWWRTGKTGMLQSMESQRIRHDWVTAQIDFSHGKTITLTIWTFVGKAMSLLFNMLPRFVIAFLPSSKHLLISWLQSLSMVILEPKKIKSVTSYFPFIS